MFDLITTAAIFLQDEAKAEASPSPPPKRPPPDENAYKWFYKDPQGEVQGEYQQESQRHHIVSPCTLTLGTGSL